MRILVTRPQPGADAVAADLRALGHRAMIEPLLEIRPLSPPPDDIAALRKMPPQALAFTSANAPRTVEGLDIDRDLPCFSLSGATADAAVEAGFTDVRRGGRDVAELTRSVVAAGDADDGPVVHLCGREVAGDLTGELERAGFSAWRLPVYEAVAVPELSQGLRQRLGEAKLDAALFFSPRTADTFVRLVSDAGLAERCTSVLAVCLSPAVAERLQPLAFRRVIVADKPERAAMIRAVAALA